MNEINDTEILQLLKRAHDLGIIAISGTVVNEDILRDAIDSTEKIYADPEFQRLAASMPPAPQRKLSQCKIQVDPSLLRDVVTALEEHPLDFHAIAQEMDAHRRNPER